MTCCPGPHLFDTALVATRWWPRELQCLMIGESPGNPGSDYFYDPIPPDRRDPVEVRRHLLDALTRRRLLPASTLLAFKGAGFLFDHALRCQLEGKLIERERRLARRFRSPRAHAAQHLVPLIDAAPQVWIMGAIARDAVAHLCRILPAQFEPLLLDVPGVVRGYPKFFVSRYLNRHATRSSAIDAIVDEVARFLEQSPGQGDGLPGTPHSLPPRCPP